MERLTGFKVREAVFVLLGYTVDPARNGKTNSQHIPATQEEMTETKWVKRLANKIFKKLKFKCKLNHMQIEEAQQVLTWSESRRARAEPSQRKKDETQTAWRLTHGNGERVGRISVKTYIDPSKNWTYKDKPVWLLNQFDFHTSFTSLLFSDTMLFPMLSRLFQVRRLTCLFNFGVFSDTACICK